MGGIIKPVKDWTVILRENADKKLFPLKRKGPGVFVHNLLCDSVKCSGDKRKQTLQERKPVTLQGSWGRLGPSHSHLFFSWSSEAGSGEISLQVQSCGPWQFLVN